MVRADQTLSSISSPGKRGRPARANLVELDENSGDYSEIRAQLEQESKKSTANKQQLDLAKRQVLALQQHLTTVEKENGIIDSTLEALARQQQDLEREICVRRDFAGQLQLKLNGKASEVRELVVLCAKVRTAHEGLAASLEEETRKAAALKRSRALMLAE